MFFKYVTSSFTQLISNITVVVYLELRVVVNFTQIYLQWNKEQDYTEVLATVGMMCTFVFVIEVVMKNIAFTPRGYLQSRRNRYDLFVTVFGVIWITIHVAFRV